VSGHDALGFPRTPIFIKKIFGGAGFQPVPAQAKACGYILSVYLLYTECKIPAGQHCRKTLISESIHLTRKANSPERDESQEP
jgi:hypothetical protein